MQIFQRIGDKGGVLHRFTDGAGLGGTEIGGLDPLTLRGRNAWRRRGWAFVAAVITALLATIIPTVFTPVIPTRLAGLWRWFRGNFSHGFIRRFASRFDFMMIF